MIRAVTPGDAERVAGLIRAAFAVLEGAAHPPPSALLVTAEDVRAHMAGGGAGALHGDEGCVLWIARADALHLSRLSVLPAFRGRGIAWALLAHGEAVARASGLRRLTLQTRLALAGNRRLFRRAGFIEGALHTHPGFDHPTFTDAEKRLEHFPSRLARE